MKKLPTIILNYWEKLLYADKHSLLLIKMIHFKNDIEVDDKLVYFIKNLIGYLVKKIVFNYLMFFKVFNYFGTDYNFYVKRYNLAS